MRSHETRKSLPLCGLVIVAAGRGKRFGGYKQLMELNQKPLLLCTLEAFEPIQFSEYVIVLPEEWLVDGTWERLQNESSAAKVFTAVAGGSERADSVLQGLSALSTSEFAAIHDGARPFPPIECLTDATKILENKPEVAGVVIGSRMTDTVKRLDKGQLITCTEDRASLRRAETPQIVRREILAEVLMKSRGVDFHDDVEALERAGYQTAFAEHSGWNIKVTYPEDVMIAEALMKLAETK